MTDDQDWRLKVELHTDERGGLLDRLIGDARSPSMATEVRDAVASDIVITHDGSHLFAYSASRAGLETGRKAIEAVIRNEETEATVVVSHWDERLDEWLQIDPPLTGDAKQAEQMAQRAAETVESRTMVAGTGNLIRAEFEQTMLEWANKLGLRFATHEHRHLLTTQVAFTVTGPKRKIDEFAEGLRSEEIATVRIDRAGMFSPL
jgi:hypothetical protein